VGKGKVKFTLEQAMKVQRGVKVFLYTLPSAFDGVGGQPQDPAYFLAGKQPAHIVEQVVCPHSRLDGCGKSLPYRNSIPGSAKIKNCLKVTGKQKTEITVDKGHNLMKLKYLSFFLSYFLFSSVLPLLTTDCRCRGLLLHPTTHNTHTQIHVRAPLDEGSERPKPENAQHPQHTDIHAAISNRHPADSRLTAT
jgi:hypothetical protein